jgi:hypothetical protein
MKLSDLKKLIRAADAADRRAIIECVADLRHACAEWEAGRKEMAQGILNGALDELEMFNAQRREAKAREGVDYETARAAA